MSTSLRVLHATAAAALAGCAAAVDVRSVGTGIGEPPAFQLRGGNLAALDARTRQLCPAGHHVLRQWQKLHQQTLAPPRLAEWVAEHGAAQGLLSQVLDDGEAQMTVQCERATAPVVSTTAAPPAAPSTTAP